MRLPSYLVKAAASFLMIFSPNLILRWFSISSILRTKLSVSNDTQQPLLRLNAQNEFHIAIFSDLHYGEEEDGWGIDQDINSTRVMENVLDAEMPDFVIFDGDLITGENTFRENSSTYVDVIVKPLVDRNVRWASTYGNHDSQFNLSREALFAEESKYSLSYTQHSPAGIPGVTNYYLPIYPAEPASDGVDTPLAILWFFDSQGGAPYQSAADSEQIPNWVDPAIVSWFQAEQTVIHEIWGQDFPSLAFVHIPPTSFLDVQNTVLTTWGELSAFFPGLNEDLPLAAEGTGLQDGPFMQALVDTPGLHSVYSGHDHGDSWCGNWPASANVVDGVSSPHVCFCKHSGYGGYGNWNRGSRVLSLSFGDPATGDMEVESWVRMENGEVVQKISLNGTYGSDVYATAVGEDYSV